MSFSISAISLLNDKRKALKKTFRLSSRPPHAFTIYYELIKINFQHLKCVGNISVNLHAGFTTVYTIAKKHLKIITFYNIILSSLFYSLLSILICLVQFTEFIIKVKLIIYNQTIGNALTSNY